MRAITSGATLVAHLSILTPHAHAQVDCNEAWRFDIANNAPFVRAGASTLVDTPDGMRLVVLGARTGIGVFPERWTLAIWDGRAWEDFDLPDDVELIDQPALAARATPEGIECIVGGDTFFNPLRAGTTHGTPRYRTGSGWDVVEHANPFLLRYTQVFAIEEPNTPTFLGFEGWFSNATQSPLVTVSNNQWTVLTPTTGSTDWGDARFGFVANDGTGERLYLSNGVEARASVFDASTSTWTDLPTSFEWVMPMRGRALLNGQHAVLLDSGLRLDAPNEPVRAMQNGAFIDAIPPIPDDLLLTYVGSAYTDYPFRFARIAPICGRDSLVYFGPVSASRGTTTYQRAFGWNGEEMIRFGRGIAFEGVNGLEHHRGSFYIVGNFSSVDGTIVPGVARWGGPSDPLACPADLSGDSRVDFVDLNAVLASFGLSQVAREAGDVTGDAIVDFSDLNEVLAAFGAECD